MFFSGLRKKTSYDFFLKSQGVAYSPKELKSLKIVVYYPKSASKTQAKGSSLLRIGLLEKSKLFFEKGLAVSFKEDSMGVSLMLSFTSKKKEDFFLEKLSFLIGKRENYTFSGNWSSPETYSLSIKDFTRLLEFTNKNSLSFWDSEIKGKVFFYFSSCLAE